MAKKLLFLAMALLLVACDPGWRYRAPPGAPVKQAEPWVQVATEPGVDAWVQAHVFTSTLTVELEVTSADNTPLEVAPDRLVVLDRDGRPFERSMTGPVQCVGHTEPLVMLDKTRTCRMEATYQVDPSWLVLRTITVKLDGLVHRESSSALQAHLQKEHRGRCFGRKPRELGGKPAPGTAATVLACAAICRVALRGWAARVGRQPA